jgi:hypothetical protein
MNIVLETYKNGDELPKGLTVVNVRRIYENARTGEQFIDVVGVYAEPANEE